MSDERVERLAKQLLSDGYLDDEGDEGDARIAARRVLWAVDNLPGDPPVDAEALSG